MTETLFYKLFIDDCELNNEIAFMVYIDFFLKKRFNKQSFDVTSSLLGVICKQFLSNSKHTSFINLENDQKHMGTKT